MMKIEVEEYLEQDCGRPCTECGCPGHQTDIIISICIGDVVLHTPWYDDGCNYDQQAHDDLLEIIGLEIIGRK